MTSRVSGSSLRALAVSALVGCGVATNEPRRVVDEERPANTVVAPLFSVSATAQPSATTRPTESGACPADMVLVEGDYCEDLEVKCLEQFHAPQNHLWVCKRVEEPTRCLGATRKVRYCIDRYEFPNRAGSAR